MARISTGPLGLGFCLALLSCRAADVMGTPLKKAQGMNVSLFCNTSGNLTNIKWMKNETLIFTYHPERRKLVTKFPSARMNVDPATPTVLHISDVQESDEGIYTCEVATVSKSLQTQTWNLTIYPDDKQKSKPISTTTRQTSIISVASSVSFCSIIIISCGIICICRIKKKQNNSGSQGANERGVPENHDQRLDQNNRRNQNSQYFERYNSVYGQF